jgi:hypothetical protein
MLNTYFQVVVPPVVRRHGGDVDRIIGDALMVTFNKRGDQPDHAWRAAAAGLAMQDATARVADTHAGWPRFRVGVNSGRASVSLLGTEGGRAGRGRGYRSRYPGGARGHRVDRVPRMAGAQGKGRPAGSLQAHRAARPRVRGARLHPVPRWLTQSAWSRRDRPADGDGRAALLGHRGVDGAPGPAGSGLCGCAGRATTVAPPRLGSPRWHRARNRGRQLLRRVPHRSPSRRRLGRCSTRAGRPLVARRRAAPRADRHPYRNR